MSGIAASPRSSKSFERANHGPHTQRRHLHVGPSPAQPPLSLSPSAMLPAYIPGALTPSESRGHAPSSSGSTGYFNFVVDPNDPAHSQYSKKNWSPASSSIRSAAARSPLPVHVDNPSTPFQQQVEVLSQRLQRPTGSRQGPDSLLAGGQHETQIMNAPSQAPIQPMPPHVLEGDYFSAVRTGSPATLDHSGASGWNSVPAPTTIRLTPTPATGSKHNRAATLPNVPKDGDPTLISPQQLSNFLSRSDKTEILLLDVRTYKLFAESRIPSAVNLCIPTTLLKRPSFNVAKLSETFANDSDKEKFGRWKSMRYIIVYDQDSNDPGDSSGLTALHTLSKFSREGWSGHSYMLKGGFSAFCKTFPDQVDGVPLATASNGSKKLTLGGLSNGAEKVGGGIFNCPLPAQQSVVNPFFSNIRQNMDLIGGVGEIPVQLPQTMGRDAVAHLPTWLKEVTCDEGNAKVVADRFLKIEKAEQRRMQEALNVSVMYDSPLSVKTKPHTLAGVEKGAKNRYNNIWPYDHARVKLQNYPQEECDYVNASHVNTQYGQRRYIASQAPLPSTFRDFWSMVWEQDVRVIVMLTAEEEGGRVKSHNYWKSDKYGSLRLNCIQERKVSLDPSSLKGSPKRRTTSLSGSHPLTAESNVPFIIVRKFTLEHGDRPFSPMREITQLQYSAWPDLGTPAHPAHVLGLVEHTDAVSRSVMSSDSSPVRRPVLVHCSAGCGRTGTFCTIDSVISMMKRQRLYRKRQMQEDSSDDNSNMNMKRLELDDGDWLSRDDQDLVYCAVNELRDQRISMVQCLQQYVLCYETVLEWMAKQPPLDSGKRKA